MSDLETTLYDIVHAKEAKEYWMRKDQLPMRTIEQVDWEVIGTAMKETKRARRVFLSKHICGMCGVGKFMKLWKKRQDDRCPRCGEHEDAPHVWTCHDAGANDIWEKALTNLDGWFNAIHTDPDIQHLILQHLRSWRNGTDLNLFTKANLRDILEQQSQIGWRRFFEGWLSRDWITEQQRYYNSIRSLRTGKRWAVALIKKMWDTAWDLWEHRNGILHATENVVSDAEIRLLHRKVTDIFNRLQSLLLPPHDRHLISLPVSRLLKKDRIYKEAWLTNALAAISGHNNTQWSKRHAHEVMIRGMQLRMRQCLRACRPQLNS